jgi:hypothetical protein
MNTVLPSIPTTMTQQNRPNLFARTRFPRPNKNKVADRFLMRVLSLLNLVAVVLVAATMLPIASAAEELGRPRLYAIQEITFTGPNQTARDVPARDIDFWVLFHHQSGMPEYKVHGFWDGDGRGGADGNIYRVRFCPTAPGRWNLATVQSSARELTGQKQGDYVTAVDSPHPGFWIIDADSPGQRWYRRSNGSHKYIFGNTHYTFLSGYREGNRPSGNDIAADIRSNAEYFKKLRFGIHPDRYPHPTDRPFLDDEGKPTNDGDYPHRPNPAWFSKRVDVAVKEAFEADLIADLILCGPDVEDSRTILRARHNNNDPRPYLKYIAARYGSFPNVWLCLGNEYDIKQPKYTEQEVARFGQIIREYLSYPTPLSVHASQEVIWSAKFDKLPAWNDHQIVQRKLKKLDVSADTIHNAWQENSNDSPRNKPSINDELSYEGAGDKHSEGDTIESHLGAFLGGGYASTGSKPGNKLGQYFIGNFDAAEHKSADNLRFLRRVIDANISFWKMSPDQSIFANAGESSRGMAWPEQEHVLGTNKSREGIITNLPAGKWRVTQHDVIAQQSTVLADQAEGRFTFNAPNSRAVLFHFKKR